MLEDIPMSDIGLLKGKKIFVVDDEPDILAVLEELLDKGPAMTISISRGRV